MFERRGIRVIAITGAIFVLTASILLALRDRHIGLYVGSEVTKIGKGEASYFVKKCRYLTPRGIFEQTGAEESMWRLERYSCAFLLM